MAKSEGNQSIIKEPWASDEAYLLRALANPCNPRGYKEAALGCIRDLEARTGRQIYRNANGGSSYNCRNASELARLEEEGAMPGGGSAG